MHSRLSVIRLSKATEPKEIDDVAPAESDSIVSHRSKGSSQSSHSSALIVAEAEQAALKARYAALKEKHALEEKEQMLGRQMEQIRKQKETLEMETELVAASAKVSILKEGDLQIIEEEQEPVKHKIDTQSVHPEEPLSSKNPVALRRMSRLVQIS
ncbi:hypothetical protein QQF64_020347 [Cirrhinus molitorella]|uniref:Uncharacterized protein n=1 Tax=Cirrhinus molitorella TaxID=172907 RepID=A0ABR3LCI1_9TELE